MPLILQRLLPRAPFFGASHASSTSQPSAQGLHPAWVVLWISVWMAAVCNVPLWREVLHLPGNTGVRGWAFLAAFMVLVTAGNAALLSLLAWRWTLKPAAGLLVLMAAFGAYFMLAYGIAIDASMLTNVLQTDVKEAGDLLNWQLPLTVGALAVPPVAWLVRQPVRAVAPLRHTLHNAGLFVAAVLVAVGAVLLVFQDFASTMRNHTQLRYLINPLNTVYALGNIATKPLRMDTRTILPVGRDA